MTIFPQLDYWFCWAIQE